MARASKSTIAAVSRASKAVAAASQNTIANASTDVRTPIVKKSRSRSPTAETVHRQSKKLGSSYDVEGEYAAAHLITSDERWEPIIKEHGTITLSSIKPESSAFAYLLKAIVFQQLASKAATTIHNRVLAAIESDPPTPAAVLATPLDALRSAGLSERKASYLLDLATHFADGRLNDDLLQSASDEELVRALTAVKGVGPATCESFLIFQLERPDVLPVGNLGVRKGYAKFYGLEKMPTAAEMEELSEEWRPYRSYASYYLWKAAGCGS